ncbi:MAG: hypothetical protein K9W46_01615 [Candidatus Heimdallarchaeum endolithica]|uniref:Uncharacterized protein n=1 Tax=Candidatus Heimdallarchaeum endolithica TaxID=2876572 RepID=A0A9Y1BS24_9ARCH|nr:MAG: hypothetical protein K9W46_01615 [Candidatus Heimdallarchaeum endolithica]
MAIVLNPIISMLITMSVFGFLFLLIFIGLRKINTTIKDIRLRRKLAAAKLIKEAKMREAEQ